MTPPRTRALILAATFALAGCHNSPNPNPPNQPVVLHGPAVQQGPVPTPPTADQISPSSPQAILHGDSTTQTTTRPPQPNH